jgi:hypothetical protein
MTRKSLLIAGIIAILIVWAILYWHLCIPEPVRTYQEITPKEKAYFSERFKYHGIGGCECDGDVCWFVRDGKRMKL